MAEASTGNYLSIGEVLGLLLEEFPDVTISKIRFLESQGLISPERTASGYRKFYDEDVDLLRVILTEQRQNFLPLRVIKDRLETGEIDPTGEHLRPAGAGEVAETDAGGEADDVPAPDRSEPAEPTIPGLSDDDAIDVPTESVAAHPASRVQPPPPAPPAPRPAAPADRPAATPAAQAPTAPPAPPQLLPGVLLDRAEFCAMVGITDDELAQLESFGVIQPEEGVSGAPVYDDAAVEIAKPASEFLRAGIDARHLRNFRTAAEREASLYEQIITPRFRQRNPEARAEALSQLRDLDDLGAKLRAAMTREALGHHFRS
jgi:DNA-binding transcriptional MerR regulator